MGFCCKQTKKCGLKKPTKKCEFKKPTKSNHNNNCKKPPVSSKNHYKDYKCLPEEKHCIVNENFYDNYYEKCNHYYVTDCNHITDHYHEYNIYHYDTKTTHEKKYTCEDIEENDPKNSCLEKKDDCEKNEICDCCHEYDYDYCKDHRENSDC
ncbi:hypothetical protein GCM10008904_29060 [Paraclostridium ghonii]|uniref:Spore coat protein n=1 Tax=Paraclostridium ghonii TaxID=29358 RepID=A0ABU0MXQ1_9FIRM|nr:hypothetical protein [Paeniclostridium ghonii]MDQ0555689.1 hypothetical protein [Paeniclostridium ghonii]